MKLLNTKGNAFCSDFCFIDTVSFVKGACEIEFQCAWVVKLHQISCQRPVGQLYSVEGFIERVHVEYVLYTALVIGLLIAHVQWMPT